MALRRRFACLCAIAWLATCPVASASLLSTFDTGDEGWSVDSSQGTAGVTDFGWTASGGNPGGSVQARDIGNQGGWWFVAPTAWAGDWSGYLGGTISFDVFATPGTSTTPNPPVEAVVLALADGGRLRAVQGAGAILDQWTSVEIELTAANFTLTNSAYSTFDEALAHVTRFVILGDFVLQQQDMTRLDNVRVSAVPEPATWALMLGGLVAVRWGRRSHRRSGARRRSPEGGRNRPVVFGSTASNPRLTGIAADLDLLQGIGAGPGGTFPLRQEARTGLARPGVSAGSQLRRAR